MFKFTEHCYKPTELQEVMFSYMHTHLLVHKEDKKKHFQETLLRDFCFIVSLQPYF